LRIIVSKNGGKEATIRSYVKEARHVSNALPLAISIDNFIDSQRGNEKLSTCGKLAIVRSILEAEEKSKLYFDKSKGKLGLNSSRLEKTWYPPFFQLLTENCSKDDLYERFKFIALIIFNYDRCVEQFLYYALQNYYEVSDQEAAEVIKNIPIYHPYGSVGSLPWQEDKGTIEFGAKPKTYQLVDLISKIKTFTEETDPRSINDVHDIKFHVSNACKLVFLGFAFHKQNMQLIAPRKLDKGVKKIERLKPKCFATTFGISESDMEVIKGQVCDLYTSEIPVTFDDISCCEFFKKFWRSLTF